MKTSAARSNRTLMLMPPLKSMRQELSRFKPPFSMNLYNTTINHKKSNTAQDYTRTITQTALLAKICSSNQKVWENSSVSAMSISLMHMMSREKFTGAKLNLQLIGTLLYTRSILIHKNAISHGKISIQRNPMI